MHIWNTACSEVGGSFHTLQHSFLTFMWHKYQCSLMCQTICFYVKQTCNTRSILCNSKKVNYSALQLSVTISSAVYQVWLWVLFILISAFYGYLFMEPGFTLKEKTNTPVHRTYSKKAFIYFITKGFQKKIPVPWFPIQKAEITKMSSISYGHHEKQCA